MRKVEIVQRELKEPSKLMYMHCTGSNILLLLPQTGLKLVSSTLDLLYKYQLSPMSGELSCAFEDSISIDPATGTMAFAKINPDRLEIEINCFGSTDIRPIRDNIHQYGSRTNRNKSLSTIQSNEQLISMINNALATNFVSLNKLVLDILIAKQLGILNDKGPLIDNTSLEEIKSRSYLLLEKDLQISQLFLLLYKWVRVHGQRQSPPPETYKQIMDALCEIIKSKLVPNNFYRLNDEEQKVFVQKFVNYMPAIKDLKFSVNESGFDDGSDIYIQGSRGLLSVLRSPAISKFFDKLVQEESYLYFPFSFYGKSDVYNIKECEAKQFMENFTRVLNCKKDRVEFLFKLLAGEVGNKLPDRTLDALEQQSFPIAFMLTSDQTDKLSELSNSEFRPKQDLSLGLDIQQVAVKKENYGAMHEFLLQHGLQNRVTILNIDTLQPLARPSMLHQFEAEFAVDEQLNFDEEIFQHSVSPCVHM